MVRFYRFDANKMCPKWSNKYKIVEFYDDFIVKIAEVTNPDNIKTVNIDHLKLATPIHIPDLENKNEDTNEWKGHNSIENDADSESISRIPSDVSLNWNDNVLNNNNNDESSITSNGEIERIDDHTLTFDDNVLDNNNDSDYESASTTVTSFPEPYDDWSPTITKTKRKRRLRKSKWKYKNSYKYEYKDPKRYKRN